MPFLMHLNMRLSARLWSAVFRAQCFLGQGLTLGSCWGTGPLAFKSGKGVSFKSTRPETRGKDAYFFGIFSLRWFFPDPRTIFPGPGPFFPVPDFFFPVPDSLPGSCFIPVLIF